MRNTKSELLILFDLGNILVKLNSVDQFWYGQDPEPVHEICQQRWIGSQAVRDLETGKIKDLKHFYQMAARELELDLDYMKFEKIFISLIGDKFAQTDLMLAELSQHYRLMILSDTSEPHWRYCEQELGLGHYIEKAFLSYELGFMKPDKRVYKTVLSEVDVIPQNIYYFDDKTDNVKAGKLAGMNAYVSWGGETLICQLKQIGLLSDNVNI
jgi:putative hydrolase of the HAD superfamily